MGSFTRRASPECCSSGFAPDPAVVCLVGVEFHSPRVNPAASPGDRGGGSLVLPAPGYQGEPEEFSSVVSGPTEQVGCRQMLHIP